MYSRQCLWFFQIVFGKAIQYINVIKSHAPVKSGLDLGLSFIDKDCLVEEHVVVTQVEH